MKKKKENEEKLMANDWLRKLKAPAKNQLL